MRGTAGGLLTTVLLLTLLQAVVSSDKATGRLGALLAGAGTVIEHLASPAIPAIPDLRPGANRNASPVLDVSPTSGTTAAAPAVARTPRPRLPVIINNI